MSAAGAECVLLLSEGYSKNMATGQLQRSPSDDEGNFIDIQTTAQPDISSLPDRSHGTLNLTDTSDYIPPSYGQYEDFHTIDWQRDLARDRMRHRFISKKRSESFCDLIWSVFDAGSGWICVLLVGIVAGCVAGIIDIGARWMSDIKDGLCVNALYFDREHCCWSANDTFYAGDKCDQWLTWSEILGHKGHDSLSYFLEFIFYVFWAIAFAGLAALMVRVLAPYACGSGIPEIKCILSGFIIRGYLGKWTLLVKSVGLILSSASGLSLGKEGPMVHVACCIGNIWSYMFPKYGKNEAKKREILSAAAAAGVSVAFGAPIGGVLFSLEEASYYFPLKTLWRSFFCALVSGMFLRFINPFGSAQTSLFSVDYRMRWAYIELLPFIMLGIFGGVIGSIFIRANIWWCRYRKTSRLGQYPIVEVLVVTAMTAVLSFPNEYTRMSASQMIRHLFDRCGPEDYSDLCNYVNRTYIKASPDDVEIGEFGPGLRQAIWKLALAAFFKLFITVFTFGIKVPAGLFIPSMAVGAIVGRLTGIGMEQMTRYYQGTLLWSTHCRPNTQCILPGLYAMVGAAAVLGGVTKMTVSLVVIMFELTGSLEFIVPTMCAVMFAKWVGDAAIYQGIYDAHIDLNGYPFLDNKGEFVHTTIAGDAMRPKSGEGALHVITEDTMTVGDVEQLLRETDHNGFPVVVSTDSPNLVGFVSRRDLNLAIVNARRMQDGIVTNSLVTFSSAQTSRLPEVVGAPVPLKLRKLVDLAPITVTVQTPMETVIDMFRRLGVRQVLVIENGRLLGIITKKDVLRHIKQLGHQEPIGLT